ncbi:hypothetical protein IHO40_01210 [Wolbachia endosymbiont of Mansonella ozzardi]|uniref:ankyrin repeat domain-containing protein n=1 Tax=Wolbachia endosymbiont of Mansonella ozzardi TaxID=137464 RepID=UPI001CE20B88|nr:ankyrin repeat domain-containing protein [Wolbachia endosymbiont of Mansonella ozzardi]MCA4774790.1 hypothetical protein [Wolbachia endosymbiont of Mansonella ozzardi]
MKEICKEEFANLSVKDSKALHDATRNGELEALRGFVKLLMNEEADIHAKDATRSKKPIHNCC